MLKPNQPPVLSATDDDVFARVVPADHYLRKVKRDVDFERCRLLCQDAYAPTMGRPGIDPVLMLKLLFLRFHYRLSDRQVIERSRTDMAFRFFLDLPLDQHLPDHTNGTHFRQRLGEERFERIFQSIVTQAREHGLVQDRLRLKDATHLLADVRDLRPLELVAQIRTQLLKAAEPFFAAWVTRQQARFEVLRLTTAEFSDDERLAARIEHLRQLSEELPPLCAALPVPLSLPDRPRDRLQDALTTARQALAYYDDPQVNERLVNANDADARIGKHGSFYVGYLQDVMIDADSEIITAINVLPANGAEAADAIVLLQQEELAQGNDVQGLSMDGAGYHGPVLRELTDPNGLNIEVTVPPPQAPPRTTFGPERFALNVLGELTCPAGQSTHTRERKEGGFQYVFRPSQCRGCALREECLQNPRSKGGRTVIKNEYEAEYQKVKDKAQTAEYRETRRMHPKIERKLAELTRYHGARRASYRRRGKVRIQAFLTALVVNVKRMVKLLSAERPSTQTVRAELASPA